MRCPARPSSRRRDLARLGVLVAAIALVPAHAQAAYEENAVKAALVERFTQFIDWPPGSLGAETVPFTICLLGETPMRAHLERLSSSRRIQGRPTEVRHVRAPAELVGCQVAWISDSAGGVLDEALRVTAGKPILTVSDTRGFAERGVLINLRRADQRLTFDVNLAAARRSGLHISSRLLKLGRIVGGEGGP